MTPDSKSTSLTIMQPDNMRQIAALGPTAFEENTLSHDRCIYVGQQLLDRISREGINDELDQELASYIKKAKATLAKMNDRRSPLTKLFDQIRTVFTTLEADVDPTKAATAAPRQVRSPKTCRGRG